MHRLAPLVPAGHVVLHYRHPAGKAVLVRSRSKIRSKVCRCLAGRRLSSSRIRSMIPTNGFSFGRAAYLRDQNPSDHPPPETQRSSRRL